MIETKTKPMLETTADVKGRVESAAKANKRTAKQTTTILLKFALEKLDDGLIKLIDPDSTDIITEKSEVSQ